MKILLLVVQIVQMLIYIIFGKKNVYANFLFNKIVKMLLKVWIDKIQLLVVLTKVR